MKAVLWVVGYLALIGILSQFSSPRESGLRMAATAPTTYSEYKTLKQEAMINCGGDVTCYEMSKP